MSFHSLYADNGYVNDGYVQTGITINWATRVIFVPKTETTLIQTMPSEVRELDADYFRLTLKDLEDSQIGVVYPDTHKHNTEVVLGGLTYARTVEIINGYTVTFEDGQYAVNIVGANTNIGDVINLNQVSVRIANSAGLIQAPTSTAPTATQVATEVWERLLASHVDPTTFGGIINVLNTRTLNTYNVLNGVDFKLDLNLAKTDDVLLDTQSLINSLQLALDIVNEILKYNANRTKIDKNAKTLTVFDDNGITPLKVFDLKDFNGVASITEIAERAPQ